jgi:hypothetical protein
MVRTLNRETALEAGSMPSVYGRSPAVEFAEDDRVNHDDTILSSRAFLESPM